MVMMRRRRRRRRRMDYGVGSCTRGRLLSAGLLFCNETWLPWPLGPIKIAAFEN
jgi:hypothetical protein